MSLDANKAVVTRFFDEILNRRRPDTIMDLVDRDVVVHHSFLDGGSGSLEAVGRLMQEFARAFPDLTYTVDDVVGEADRVAVRWTAHALHRGEFRGVAATGRSIAVSGIDMFAFASGKIVEAWVGSDLLGLIEQIGVFERPSQRRLSFETAHSPGEAPAFRGQ